MPDRHITLFHLLRVYEGQDSPKELAEYTLAHLRAICSQCDEGYTAFALAMERRNQRERAAHDYGPALEKMAAESAAQAARLARDEKRARREVTDLLVHTPAEWKATIEKARARYRSPAAAEGLLAEARSVLRDRPAFSLDLLTAARQVAHRIEPGLYGATLCHETRVRAEALLANGLRVVGELRGADALWGQLHANLNERPISDDALRAELASLEASLRQDQSRFDQAEELLEGAEKLYRRAGDRQGVAKALLKRSTVANLQLEFDKALNLVTEAGAWVDTQADPGLAWAVWHNRALCLCDLERFHEAETCFQQNEAHSSTSKNAAAEEVSRTWLAGRIAVGVGRAKEARELLGRTRNEFLLRRLPFNAALVSLDLAAVLLAEGETFEVKRLAEQTARTFEQQSVHPQLAKALALFQSAAVAESVTRELLADLRRQFAAPRRPGAPNG